MRKFVSKSWGYEDWIHNSPEYCGKLLFVKKGLKCSLHYHKLKMETFYVHSGKLLVEFVSNDDFDKFIVAVKRRRPIAFVHEREAEEFIQTKVLVPGDHMEIPRGTVHRFTAVLDTHLFEFSTQHFDEDSYRINLDQ